MQNTNIDIVADLFSEGDIDFFLYQTHNKKWEEIIFIPEKGIVNYYERYSLNTFDNNTDRLEHFLYKRYKKKYTLCDTGAWVNKVSTHTNKNDFFHLDNSDLTIVTYLNDNFDGGEFEYIDDNGTTIKIKPKKGLSLIMNNKLPHRVLPVNNGNRLSLVCFFELLKKETKSIL